MLDPHAGLFDLLGKLNTKQVGVPISILAVMDAFTRDQFHTWLDEPLTSSEFKRDAVGLSYVSGWE